LLTSKTNLAGTTTYTYEKLSNGDSKVTEYSPDNDQKITYTNKLGQNYKSSVKGFADNSYVSQEVQFDVLGRKIKESEPYLEGNSASKWNVIDYDDYSRPIKITQYTGKITTSSYSGRTVTATETNANNRFKTQVFDAIGNVTSTTDKGGTIEFKYNAAGENIESKYDKNVVATQYDNWGRKSLFNDPSNGIYQYEYNGYGQLIHTTSPKGHKYYSYDEFGRLYNQYEVSNDNTSTKKNINITYNSKGLITNKSGTSNGQAYSSYVNYDANGRVISSGENSNGRYFYKKAIAYDDKGRITSYEKGMLSSGINTKTVLENRYSNWSGEMYQLKDKNSSKVLWELTETNAKGLVLKAKLGASSIENTYDANNFLSNVSHTTIVNGVTNTALQIAYSFNAIKNELNSRATGGNFNILESFTYDDNNRLVNWTNPKTGQLSNNVYDAKGRIIENDQLGTIKYDDNSTTIYRPTGATLNANGQQNLTNDLIQSISYNENNDPIKITGEKGDVYFTYGLTNMRQAVGYGGKLDWTDEGRYTKYYSEDGSYEVVIDNTTGKEKHVMYIGGTPYEANIVYLKNYTESSGSYKFLHKDYLGSILAITDEDGNIKEQRHFDAWGNLTHFKVNGVNKNVNEFNNLSLIDRGYTSHEHFTEVGIIHMNGRLYDPLLRRFLNADEFVQDPNNTQNYNKYGYVMNNPLMHNDPTGEIMGWDDVLIAIGIAIFTSIATDYYLNRPVNLENMFQSVVMAVVSAGMSNGIGEIFKAGDTIAKALKGWTWVARAGAHAIAQGTLSYMQGGNFWSGALAGAFASVANDVLGYYIDKAGSKSFIKTKGFALITGAVSGGVGSVLGGGNFWMGAGQGLIVTAFNFLAHRDVSNNIDNDTLNQDDPYVKKTSQKMSHKEFIDFIKRNLEFNDQWSEYFDTAADWLGSVSIADFVKDLFAGKFKPTPLMAVGQMSKVTADNLNDTSKDLIKIQNKYLQLHKNNPSHMKGIRLEQVHISSPVPAPGGMGASTTFYKIYDNYTNKLLGNGTW
jgi:RHS repeat-associated protein